jgi:hypothetical protein
MKKRTVFDCDESEILKLINNNIAVQGVDSLVALEELGNQVWCVGVTEATESEVEEIEKFVDSGEYPRYLGVVMLNYLCKIGVLESGIYNIDCRW